MEKKTNLFMMLLTSILCVLPVILLLVYYKELPNQIPISPWIPDGNEKWHIHKAIFVLKVPLIFFVCNVIIRIAFFKDSMANNVPIVVRTFLEWFAPVLSFIVTPIRLFFELGVDLPIFTIGLGLPGLFFIICGNYLPKTKQNKNWFYSSAWTQADPDNWNKIHRIAGFIWVIGGIIMIISAFLFPDNIWKFVLYSVILISTFGLPALYSNLLSKKNA
jgi:uncharacterized membrane protein